MLIFLLCVIVAVLLFGRDLTLAVLCGGAVIGSVALILTIAIASVT